MFGVTFIVTSVPSSYSPPVGLIVPPSVGLDETVKVYIVGGISSEEHPKIVRVVTNSIIIFFITFILNLILLNIFRLKINKTKKLFKNN